MGKLIINSDDFGYSNGVNYGIVDAYRNGILTSTTMMSNMPGFEDAVKLKSKFPQLGVGVHLTLTCGSPLLKNHKIIVDETGSFLKLNFYKNDFVIDYDELYQEWDAQIQKVYKSGIIPTHLDSHHHIHSFGDIQNVVVDLAHKYDLPVRANFDKKDSVKHTTYFEPFFDDVGEKGPEDYQIDIPMEDFLSNLLSKTVENESTEIMCHTAYIDQELLEGSKFVYQRVKEVDFLCSSDFAKEIINNPNIELINYSGI